MLEPLSEDDLEPNLAPCSFDVGDITFLEFLGSKIDDDADGTPPHSRVFKVKIGRTHYALKIFKFASIEQLRPWVGENARLSRLLTDKYLRLHEDPFFRECRAFGRLNKIDKKIVRVVHCHGWLYLDDTVEQLISQKFGISEWDRCSEHGNEPLRAIIKDWIRFHTPFNRRKFKDMRQDLFNLNHKTLIFNLDIRIANYVGGWLFDFSSSRTLPHIFFQAGVRDKWRNDMDMDTDESAFDEMVKAYEKEQEPKLVKVRKDRTKQMKVRLATLRPLKHRVVRKPVATSAATSKKKPAKRRQKRTARK